MQVRCPNCHEPIEVEQSESLDELTCPLCGSTFSLLRSHETVSYRPAAPKKLAHFRLDQILGSGAFGTVWKAIDTKLDRTVAVKVPRQGKLDESECEKFLREARAAAQLRHPHIAAVHEVGRDSDTVYIVSDFIDGLTLSEWMSGHPLTIRASVTLVAKIADALAHAHQAGVVHRDLKPANVMMDHDGEPYLMDFGLAKRDAGEVTMTMDGQILGTPAYMSPEQARGEANEVDCRTDIYSLGAILFELLTGHRPFRGSTAMLLHQVIHDDPPSPRTLNGRIQRDLETICLRCLEKDRGRRYPTAKELAEDLRRLLNKEPVKARPIGRITRLVRWAQRHRGVASLAASIAVLLVVVAIGSLIFAEVLRQQRNVARESNSRAIAAEQARQRQVVELLQFKAGVLQGSTDIGRREEGLRLLGEAVEIVRSPQLVDGSKIDALRNHAILGLSLFDLQPLWTRSIVGRMTLTLGPRNKQYALVTPEGDVTVRALPDGEEILRFRRDDFEYWFVSTCFNPAGTHLAVKYAAIDRQPRSEIWDVRRGVRLLEKTANISGFGFHPQLPVVCICEPQGVVAWDYEQDRALRRFDLDFTPTMARFSSDATLLAVGTEGQRRTTILEFDSGTIVQELNEPVSIIALAWSSDDRLLAMGSPSGSITVFNTERKRTQTVLKGHVQPMVFCDFVPGTYNLVSTAMDGTIRVWDAAVGRQIIAAPGVGFNVHADGGEIGWLDGQTLGAWQVRAPDEYRVLNTGMGAAAGATNLPFSVDFSPNRSWLASSGPDGVTIWDTANGRAIANLPTGVCHTVKFHPDGSQLFTLGPAGLFRWMIAEDARVVGPPELVRDFTDKESFRFDWGPRGDWLAVVDPFFQRFAILDPKQPARPLWLNSPQTTLSTIAVSRDGQWVATGGWGEKEILVWSVRRRRIAHRLSPDADGNTAIFDVSFSPDGKWFGASVRHPGRSQFRYWDTDTWKVSHSIARTDEAAFRAPLFHPSGKAVAMAVSPDEILLAAFPSGEELMRLRVPGGIKPAPAAFSPDGRMLAAKTSEDAILLWDLSRLGQRLGEMHLGWRNGALEFGSPASAETTSQRQDQRWEVRGSTPTTNQRKAIAVERLRSATAKNVDDTQANLELGRWHYDAEQWAAARPYLQRVVERDPGHPDASFFLARIHLGEGKPELGLQELDAHLRKSPRDAEALMLAAETCVSLSRHEDAIGYLHRLIENQPRHYVALRTRAKCLIEIGQGDQAMRDIDTLLKIDPSDPDVQAAKQQASDQE